MAHRSCASRSRPRHAQRGQIGFVGQDPVLFNASIRDNITYARAASQEVRQQSLPVFLLCSVVHRGRYCACRCAVATGAHVLLFARRVAIPFLRLSCERRLTVGRVLLARFSGDRGGRSRRVHPRLYRQPQ
jgi:hypothetical protein